MSITKICSCGYVGYAALHDKKGTDVVCEHFAKDIEAEATKPCVCCEPSTPGVVHRTGGPCYVQEATKPQITGGETYPDSTEADKERLSLALDKIWGKKPQEPVGYQELFDAIAAATSVACFPGINISIEDFTAKIGPLFTTPQPCPKCAEGMVSVTKEDANNYCRILTLLGMEEEGSPVEGVERLISLRDGMTCGDCNDTGWLENREEGRYPCTCMTEAEPYQILEAERDALTSVNYLIRFDCDELRKDRDALAMQNKQMRDVFDGLIDDCIISVDRKFGTLGAGHVRRICEAALALPDLSAEVIKRHDSDKKDAERYRWVKVACSDSRRSFIFDDFCTDDIDEAIDAELEKV